MKHEILPLPYFIDALEPYISNKTMELHYLKYHNGYALKLNSLTMGTKFERTDLETIIKMADGPVFNFASQTWNHNFFFESLNTVNKVKLKGPFSEIIKKNFGTLSFFKKSFIKASLSLFGSGWVWLVWNPKGTLEIIQKSNAGNPLRIGLIPLLVCDLWEHAYYLDYHDRIYDYVDAFWKLINWDVVEKRYSEALQHIII